MNDPHDGDGKHGSVAVDAADGAAEVLADIGFAAAVDGEIDLAGEAGGLLAERDALAGHPIERVHAHQVQRAGGGEGEARAYFLGSASLRAIQESHASSRNASSLDGIAGFKGSSVLIVASSVELICGASVARAFISLFVSIKVVDVFFKIPELGLQFCGIPILTGFPG